MNQWISGKQSQKGNYIEKEKMELPLSFPHYIKIRPFCV